MINFRFSVDDIARTRFAISPMWETAAAIRALRNPSALALHLPWVKRIRPKLRELDLSLPLALLPRKGYIADFLTPPPSTPLASFEDELELVRTTPADLIRHDVGVLLSDGIPREQLQPYLDDPRGTVERLAEVLRRFWEVALKQDWPRIQAVLEADIAYRSRRLAQGGLAKLFADLHPEVEWTQGEGKLSVHRPCAIPNLPLDGKGLLLVPSAFSSQHTAAMTEAPWQPTLIYPARGIGLLWESAPTPPDALAKVLGQGRAAVLADLDAPRTTTELARRLGMSPGGVSQHLAALRDAGLVSAQRNGRSVLYCRSPLADELVTA